MASSRQHRLVVFIVFIFILFQFCGGTPTATTSSPTGSPTATTSNPTSTTTNPTESPTTTTGSPTTTTTNPSSSPTVTTGSPSGSPTATTSSPSRSPTATTSSPSGSPTATTGAPSGSPTSTTGSPTTTTGSPTATTSNPTSSPTVTTSNPTGSPTATTSSPSSSPTSTTSTPTATTGSPSGSPTATTNSPSVSPTTTTGSPTGSPTATTGSPTSSPTTTTSSPSGSPTATTSSPSGSPTATTSSPTGSPTATTGSPSSSPTATTESPSSSPTVTTNTPTATTGSPTLTTNTPTATTSNPSSSPTSSPTATTLNPSGSPTATTNPPTVTTGSPTSTTDTPTATTGSPSSAPTSTTNTPTATTISPTSTTSSPTATSLSPTSAPSATTGSPTSTTNSPTATTNPPTATSSSPTGSPVSGTDSPTATTTSPTASTLNPSATPSASTNSPTATTSNPSAAPTSTTNSPTVTTGSPTATTGSPTAATSNPSSTPTATTGSPTGSPTATSGSPTGSPTATTSNPSISPTSTTNTPTATTVNPSSSPTSSTTSPTITTISPTSITSSPTLTTLTPTVNTLSPSNSPTSMPSYNYPTIAGCGALHGFVQIISPLPMRETLISYPVGWGPFSYRLYNISVVGWIEGSAPDPCDYSTISKVEVNQKIVVFQYSASCHPQEWALNFQRMGAIGLLIADSITLEFKEADNTLSTPNIPTRLISLTDANNIANEIIVNARNIEITFDCFDDNYPALICVQDQDYVTAEFRIIGAYQRQIFDINGTLNEYDSSGHGVWIQDSSYNRGSSIDWQIWFEADIFSWVIGDDGSPGIPDGIIAYCNDAYVLESLTSPGDCNEWQIINASDEYQITPTLTVSDDLCPIDNDDDIAYYCIRSNNNLNNLDGTYKQLMVNISEWYLQSSSISYLHWGYINIIPVVQGYGWIINIGDSTSIVCNISSIDLSINNTMIKYEPSLCSNWFINSIRDESFDIDPGECQTKDNHTIISNVSLLCLEYLNTDDADGYSYFSSHYELIDNLTHNRHSVWESLDLDDDFFIIYYEIGDSWAIIENIDIGDIEDDDETDLYLFIHADNIIAMCADDGLTDNPSECLSDCWELYGWMNCSDIIISINNEYDECDAVIITTSSIPETTDDEVDGDKKEEGFDFESALPFMTLLLIPVFLICCFVWYRRRQDKGDESTTGGGGGGMGGSGRSNNQSKTSKNKNKQKSNDDGIALQPYVPTGLAYDAYEQNRNQKKKKGDKKKKKVKKKNKPVAEIGSSSIPIETNGTLDSPKEDSPFINVFDEEDNHDNNNSNDNSNDDDHNPLMDDGVIRTGHTIVNEDEAFGNTADPDIMSAFDE